MELLLLGGLTLAGIKMNQEKNNLTKKYKSTKSNKHPNVYHSDQIKTYNKLEQQKALEKKQNSMNPVNTNVIAQDYNKNQYLNQFNLQRADQKENPNAINKNGLIEEFSVFDNSNMTYGIVDESKLFHNNMHPTTSRRDVIVPNYDSHQNKLEIMTGWSKDFKHKQETPAFFSPDAGYKDINGLKLRTGELQKRYLPSTKKNDQNLPFANKQKVAPGVYDKNRSGVHGTYRILPRSVDELRAENNPKVSYNAITKRVIKKGEYRAINPNLTQFKKPDFKITNQDDLQPNYSTVPKPIFQGKIQEPRTHRTKSIEYQGHAAHNNKKEKQSGLIKNSSKITYYNNSQTRNVSNVQNKPVAQNIKSFSNVPNQRSDTSIQQPASGPSQSKTSTYTVNPNDIPLTTLREMMIYGDNNLGVTNTNNKSYAFSKDFILPSTLKDMTLHQQIGSQIQSSVNAGYAYNKNDVPNITNRVTTYTDYLPTGPYSLEKTGYANNKELAKPTIRQTTSINKYQSNVMGPDSTYSRNPVEVAKPTIRQTTSINKYQSNVMGQDSTYSRNPVEVAKPTIRQTTSFQPTSANINGGEGSYSKDIYDIARRTIKETTLNNPEPGNLKQNDYTYSRNINEIAKPTIRQSTSINNYQSNLNGADLGYSKNLNDLAKPTIRQTTVFNMKPTNLNGPDLTYAKNLNDIAKPTIRQTTIYNPVPSNIAGNDASYIINPHEIAKPTQRETTSHNKISSGMFGNEASYSKDPNDIAKPTIKQTTLFCTPGGRAKSAIDQSYSKTKGDVARETLKEQTLLQNRKGPLRGEHSKHKLFDDVKNMCTNETREIISKNRYPTIVGAANGPNKSTVNLRLKQPLQLNRANAPNIAVRSKKLENINQIYNNNKAKLNTDQYRICNDFVNTMNENPYVNNLIHQNQ